MVFSFMWVRSSSEKHQKFDLLPVRHIQIKEQKNYNLQMFPDLSYEYK